MKAPPAENKTMKRATLIGILTTTIFYMSVGCVGYAAFGDGAPGNLLTGFGFYNPYWLVDFANACIVVHLVGAYQVHALCLSMFLIKFIDFFFCCSTLNLVLSQKHNNLSSNTTFATQFSNVGVLYRSTPNHCLHSSNTQCPASSPRVTSSRKTLR